MGTKKSLLRRATAFALAFVMAFSMLFTGNTAITANAAATATKIKVAKKSISIEPGKTAKVKVTVKGSNKKFTAKSSNKKVATVKVVGKNVVIKAKNKLGKTAKITVTTKGKNNKGKKLSAKITVKVAKAEPTTEATTAATTAATTTEDENAKKVDSVVTSLNALPASTAVTVADEAKITAARKAYDSLTADQKALVSADVVKKLTDAEAALKKVKDESKPAPVIKVQSISVSLNPQSVLAEKTATATATISPSDATNKTVTWESSDPNIAKIDNNGKITAIAEGSAVIKATAADGSGISGEARLTVGSTASIKLSKSNATLIKDATVQLTTAVLIPSDSQVTYTSSDALVAEVNASTGLVTAKKEGKATITATTDYNVSSKCEITVANDDTVLVKEFNLERADGTFTVGVAMQGTDKSVSDEQLSGSKLKIANVETGNVIEATYVDGSLTNGTATYAFDSSLITSGSYRLSTSDNANMAIDIQDDSGLIDSVVVTELDTGVVGYVFDKSLPYPGKPLANATVIVYAGDEKLKTTQTDINGRYEIAAAENSGLKIVASKEGYFETSVDDVVVKNNYVTTCNMRIDNIDEEQFALVGQVSVSDNGVDGRTLSDEKKPVAVLYVKDVEEWKTLAYTKVSDVGFFAFANTDEEITYNDEYKLNDDSYQYTYANTYWFNYADGLSMDKTYKVVVYKNLLDEEAIGYPYYDGEYSDNVKAVYDKAESSEISLSKTDKNTKIPNILQLKAVPKFEGLTVEAGEIKWADDNSKPSTDKVNIGFAVLSKDTTNRILVFEATKEINLNDTKNASKEVVTLISNTDNLTLPAGDYDVVLWTAGQADVFKQITIDTAGKVTSATKLKEISFSPAVTYGFTMALKNGKFYEKEGLTDGANVNLMNLLGVKNSSSGAYLKIRLYQYEDRKQIFVKEYTVNDFVVHSLGSNSVELKALLNVNGLMNGKIYRMYFDSPVLSLVKDDPELNRNIVDKGFYEFTYNKDNPSNATIPWFKAQANVETVKMTSNAQFKNFDSKKPLFVNSVKLVKEEDDSEKVIKTATINKYYSCGNKSSLSTADQNLVDISGIYGGGDLITDGIAVGLGNIDDGTYFLKISVNGYEELTVPIDDGIELIGLEEGVYTVTVPDDSFIPVSKTTIKGRIIYNSNLVTSQVDIVVLNSKGKIAAVGTTSTGEYSIVNGENAAILNEGEGYTLVFRSAEYGTRVVSTKEALARGENTQDDVVLQKGTAKITATIYEAGTNNPLTGAFVGVYDSRFVVPEEENIVDENKELLNKYIALTYMGQYNMLQSSENKSFWEVSGVALDTSYTVIADGTTYETTTKVAGALQTKGMTLPVNNMQVPLAVTVKTTPVEVSVQKNKAVTINYNDFDVLYIYSVDSAGKESFATSVLKDPAAVEFSAVKLPAGKYNAYVYSRGYYVEMKNFTVSVNATETLKVLVGLQKAE